MIYPVTTESLDLRAEVVTDEFVYDGFRFYYDGWAASILDRVGNTIRTAPGTMSLVAPSTWVAVTTDGDWTITRAPGCNCANGRITPRG